VALLAFGLAVKPLRALRSGATGRDLVPVLAVTGILELAYAVLLAVGLAVATAIA
jgi:1,4-dihydroxy-2-naphthoate octaprenyltransferase